jgi:hypothetical protein
MHSVELHPGQARVYDSLFLSKLIRFGVVCASRGWGKSFFAAVAAATAIFELLELDESVPNKNVYIIAPTYDQVTDIYYPILAYELGMESYAIQTSRDTGRFRFNKNVELRLVSFEAVERLRGKGAYFVVNDEMSSWKKGITPKEAWEGIIQPCIITRWSEERAKYFGSKSAGRGLTISTPKGYNYFEEMYHFQERDNRWGSFHFDYRQSPFLDPEEIERIKHTIDPIQWASEYLALFQESGNSVFYMFDRKIHVRPDIEDFWLPDEIYPKGEDVHCNIDFNVGIQATSFWAMRGKQMQFIDEFQGHPDTETLAKAIKARYKDHKIFAYPDPTGNSKKTSAPVGQTDYTILKDHGIQVLARKKSPPIVNSVNAVNARLKNAADEVNMFLHPRCIGTIKSLERTKWVDRNPDTATIDKSEGVEHYSDGVRYGTEYNFPIVDGTGRRVKRGFNF